MSTAYPYKRFGDKPDFSGSNVAAENTIDHEYRGEDGNNVHKAYCIAKSARDRVNATIFAMILLFIAVFAFYGSNLFVSVVNMGDVENILKRTKHITPPKEEGAALLIPHLESKNLSTTNLVVSDVINVESGVIQFGKKGGLTETTDNNGTMHLYGGYCDEKGAFIGGDITIGGVPPCDGSSNSMNGSVHAEDVNPDDSHDIRIESYNGINDLVLGTGNEIKFGSSDAAKDMIAFEYEEHQVTLPGGKLKLNGSDINMVHSTHSLDVGVDNVTNLIHLNAITGLTVSGKALFNEPVTFEGQVDFKHGSSIIKLIKETDGVITKAMVGLGGVDNTTDLAKPVSNATQTALDLKAPLASPTFTGTVAGITKAMVGLQNVNNTADLAKPVSNATQTALDLKAPLHNPTFTGTVDINETVTVKGEATFKQKVTFEGQVDLKLGSSLTKLITQEETIRVRVIEGDGETGSNPADPTDGFATGDLYIDAGITKDSEFNNVGFHKKSIVINGRPQNMSSILDPQYDDADNTIAGNAHEVSIQLARKEQYAFTIRQSGAAIGALYGDQDALMQISTLNPDVPVISFGAPLTIKEAHINGNFSVGGNIIVGGNATHPEYLTDVVNAKIAPSEAATKILDTRLSKLERDLVGPVLSADNKTSILKSVHNVFDEKTYGNYNSPKKFDPRMFPSPVVWPKFAGQDVGYTMSSNAYLRYSTVKYRDEIFLITSAHNTGVMPPSASSDFGYEGIFPTHYLDNSEVDMFLRKSKNFVTFSEQLNLNSSLEYDPIGGESLGRSSDLWGTETVIIRPEGTMQTIKLILQTTHKGLIVSRLETKNNPYKYLKEKEVAFTEELFPVAFFHNGDGNQWGDVKTFDQTTLNIRLFKEVVDLLSIGTEVQLTYRYRKGFGPNYFQSMVLDINVEMRILSMEVLYKTDESGQWYVLKLRVQTSYDLKNDDYFYKIALWNSTGYKEIFKIPQVDPIREPSYIIVDKVTRNCATYFVKENNGRLMTFNTTMDTSFKRPSKGLSSDFYRVNNTIYQPILTNTIFNDNMADPYWEIKNGTTHGVGKVGNSLGAHNLWVSHTQQLLFVVGMNGVSVRNLTDIEVVQTAIVYDISGDKMFAPQPKALLKGLPDNYIHDLETVSYTREEQIQALGIPRNETRDMLHLAIASTGYHFVVYDTTDIENVKVVSNLQPITYEMPWYIILENLNGYNHQTSMTTDKKYFVASDELQDFQKVGAGVFIFRLYYDQKGIGDVFLKIKYVQKVTYATPSRIHNQYVFSNNDKFSENKERYEDWIVGANYHAGFGTIKLNYDEYQNASDYTDPETFELRNNPFTWKEIGNLQPTKRIPNVNVVGEGWSVFAFGDMRLPASRRHYIGNTATGTVAFVQYDKARNDKMDPKNDGYVQLLHPEGAEEEVTFIEPNTPFQKMYELQDNEVEEAIDTTRLPSPVQLKTKKGTQVHLFTNIGHSQTLDFVASKRYISPIEEWLSDIYSIEAAESTPEEGEKVYAVCGNDVISGHVVKNSETFHRIYPSRVFTDFLDYPANGVKFSRTGEMITTLKCRPGDSGSPVVNSAGHFVGIVNSVTLTTGTTGVVKFENMKPHFDSSLNSFIPPQAIESSYNGITGVLNVLNEGKKLDDITDPNKMYALAINPRNKEIIFYYSSTGTRFLVIDLKSSNDGPNAENGFYEKLTGALQAKRLINMDRFYQTLTDAESLWDFGNNNRFFARTVVAKPPLFFTPLIQPFEIYKVELVGNITFDKLMLYEIMESWPPNKIISNLGAKGPAIYFLGFADGRYGLPSLDNSNSTSERHIIGYGKTLNSGDFSQLYKLSGSRSGHPTYSVPDGGDVMMGQESGVLINVTHVFYTSEGPTILKPKIGTGTELNNVTHNMPRFATVPSFLDPLNPDNDFKTIGYIYPLGPGLTIRDEYWKRSRNSFTNLTDYERIFNNTRPQIIGLGASNDVNIEFQMTAIGNDRCSSVPDDNNIMKIQIANIISNRYPYLQIIDKINGISVDADTTHETLLRIPYVKDQKVNLTLKFQLFENDPWMTRNVTFDTIPYRDQNRYM